MRCSKRTAAFLSQRGQRNHISSVRVLNAVNHRVGMNLCPFVRYLSSRALPPGYSSERGTDNSVNKAFTDRQGNEDKGNPYTAKEEHSKTENALRSAKEEVLGAEEKLRRAEEKLRGAKEELRGAEEKLRKAVT